MIKGIKICGISDAKILNFIINHKYPPRFIGFITNYKKSRRYIPFNKLEKLVKVKKKKIKFVSVLVKPNNKELEKIKYLKFDYYQLYGVNPKRTKEIKKKYRIKIITALTVNNQKHVDEYKKYLNISDIILFDGKGYEKSVSFDHQLLNSVPRTLNKMIAGNIKIKDIVNLKIKRCFIDLSGDLENKKGLKDIKKINKLLNLNKKYEIKKRNSSN